MNDLLEEIKDTLNNIDKNINFIGWCVLFMTVLSVTRGLIK